MRVLFLSVTALVSIILFGSCNNVLAFDMLAYVPYFESRMKTDSFYDDSGKKSDIRNAMVKIYTINDTDRTDIWSAFRTRKINGSGCIIQGSMILTNAHVVAGQEIILVRKFNEVKKYQAEVLYISDDIDVAVLTAHDRHFFSGVTPLEIGELPDVQQDVSIFGFPGEENLLMTKGVFLDIEHQAYLHHNSFYLAGKINASVKPGNSGSPVIINQKIVGLIMQAAKKKDIALMVPGPFIRLFLNDIEDGHYDCMPDIDFMSRKVEQSYLLNKYKNISFGQALLQPISFL